MPDNDQSLGDQNTFDGGENQFDAKSLGDEQTFIGNEFDSFDEADDSSFGEREDLSKRYTIEGTLGKGGMGEVLLATDTRLGRKVALKRILGKAARSKKAIDRFITEAKSVAAVKHTNIVDIYDFGLATDGPYLTMEYVEGSSLEEICHKGPIEVAEAVSICCQLCDGLARAHSANIIHRDIKPANVLMTPDGVPKLTDFGLAKDDAADTGMTMAGTVLGTLDFMPPEQRKDAALTDNRSDLWSLAATLYQMVAGEPPRVIDLDLVPQQLRTTLAQALKSKKEDRYQTAIELRDALRSSLEAPEKAIQTAVLGAGECPECHTQNESSRKFCSECAASLRVSCLKCESEIPIWEKVCGECGGKQQELFEARIMELDQQKKQAEQLVGEYQFDQALAICQQISAIKDGRFSQHRQWTEGFIEATEREWDRQKELAQQHHGEAKKHSEAFDYKSAIESLERIAVPLRTPAMQQFFGKLNADNLELKKLRKQIRDGISQRSLDHLLPLVEQAIALQANADDLLTLKKQLVERESKQRANNQAIFDKASELVLASKFRQASHVLKKVSSNSLTPAQRADRNRIEDICLAEERLVSVVKQARADGIVEPRELWGILDEVCKVLELTFRHPSGLEHPTAIKLLAESSQRIEKNPKKYIDAIDGQHLSNVGLIAKHLKPFVSIEVLNALYKFVTGIRVISFGDKKLNVVRAVANQTDSSLMEAKKIVDSVPVILHEGLSEARLSQLAAELEEAGATVEVLHATTQTLTSVPATQPLQGTGIRLTSFGYKKLNVVKVVKSQTGSSLLDAKTLVESAPVILHEGLSEARLSQLAAELEEAGATVEVWMRQRKR